MDEAAQTGTGRSSRFWLYTPFALLLLIAVAWSIAWFVIRGRTDEALDSWLAAEASAGREWTCRDRTMGGYPFRIEMICSTLTLKQGAVTASFGRVESVAQVYQPRLVITEIDGPLQLTDGTVTVQGKWDLLQSSFHASPNGLQRLSLAADAPSFTVTGLGSQDIVTSGKHLELHLRANPSRAQEKAYDVAASVRQARIPALDNLVGGPEPTDLDADLTATQAEGIRGRPISEELERWRQAGGRLDILMLNIAKGTRRVEAKGTLQLDEMHRPAGRLDVAAAGLDGLLGRAVGGGTGGAVLGALFGGGQAQAKSQPSLMPLPSLRLENGKLAMGPFVVPNVRLQPVY